MMSAIPTCGLNWVSRPLTFFGKFLPFRSPLPKTAHQVLEAPTTGRMVSDDTSKAETSLLGAEGSFINTHLHFPFWVASQGPLADIGTASSWKTALARQLVTLVYIIGYLQSATMEMEWM